MKTSVRSVKFNFVMNSILTASSFIFPLITFPYISRTLGVNKYGVVTFAQSTVSYFTMFSSLGVPTYGIRACTKVRDDKNKLSKTVQELFIINAICTVIAYIAFFMALFYVERFKTDSSILVICSFAIVLNTIGVQWMFSALEQYSYITKRNISFKIASIVLMFIFIHDPNDYLIYGVVALIGTSASNILNFFYTRKFISWKKKGKYDFRQHIKPILVFFATSIAINIYTNLDSVMLGFLSSNMQVGYYAAAIKLKNVLVSLVRSLGTVLLPRMMYYVGNGLKREYNQTLKKAFNFILVVALPMTIFFIMFANETILFLSGVEYVEATPSMQVLMLTLIFIGLSGTLSDQILLPHSNEKQVCIAVSLSAAFDFLLNFVTIPRWGAFGAALSTTLAEFISLVIQGFYAKSYLKDAFKEINVLPGLVSSALAFVCCFATNKILKMSVFPTLVANAVVFFGVYGISMYASKDDLVYGMGHVYVDKILTKINWGGK